MREAANRSRCQNHLKQWSVAMQAHHDARGTLPAASSNVAGNRQSWPPQLWPYVEQTPLAQAYNPATAFHNAPNTIDNSTDGPVARPVPLYFCPSDRGAPAYVKGDAKWRSRGNYALNWGNYGFQSALTYPVLAPFGFTDFQSRDKPRRARLAEMTDGTSLTMLMAEVLMHPRDATADPRGDMMNDDGGGLVMTDDTPNNGIDKTRSTYCNSQPAAGLPCVNASSFNVGGVLYFRSQHYARSRHPGGVNATLADGSVRFFSNTIALRTWKYLGTMNDGEVVGAADLDQ